MMSSEVWLGKFNVSGGANEDEAGCGGVLRDVDGWQRHYFWV
ncbi:hypothetical protein Goari_018838 [Gossypium aridum]|uniref:Uncharacterized protein n=1 Tax=Gossypium aridum TaxID=34290 RepID=A0A7J8WRA5_GOSAI|nr:hypothetical protein [Gossypium aridum]